MREICLEQIIDSLQQLNIQEGDGLLVHSAVQFLGKPIGGIGIYLKAIQSVIGDTGTIVVPTFNFRFAKGEIFDPLETPSEKMGVFSEYVRKHPGALRTKHPMQSLATIGYYAKDLVVRDTPSAFEKGSAFDRIHELGFKLLLLGADEKAISMFHYSEQRARVPYRYWKDFSGIIHTSSSWKKLTYRMYVRDLKLDPQLTLEPVINLLKKRQQWHSISINYGSITTCELIDFVKAADEIIADDPWILVLNKPEANRL